MLTGAFFAVLGSYFAGSWVAGIACALLVGLLLACFTTCSSSSSKAMNLSSAWR